MENRNWKTGKEKSALEVYPESSGGPELARCIWNNAEYQEK
jgi:hypothetical protein